MEYTGIFCNGGVVALLFFNQIRVVDDRSQRSLDVVRNIGDQLSLHAFTFQTLFHRRCHANANAVQILAVALEIPEHSLGVHLISKITGGKSLATCLELSEHQRHIENQRDKHKVLHEPEGQQNILLTVCPSNDKDFDQGDCSQAKSGLPNQRNASAKGYHTAETHTYAAPNLTQHDQCNFKGIEDDGVLPPAPQLDPRCKAHAPAKTNGH